MNPPRERSAIVAAWLEEGPNELPESTRRAIAVDVRTTHQSRRSAWAPRWFPRLDRLTLVAVAAVAVMALVVGGLVVRPFASDGSNVGGGTPSEPSASPTPAPASAAPSAVEPRPTTLAIPPMQRTFFSERYGYTISYPADWTAASPADPGGWSPPDWRDGRSTVRPVRLHRGARRAAVVPGGLRAAPGRTCGCGRLDRREPHLFGVPDCAPPREEWEPISIDGAPGRLRDSCGEVEATVVIDGRVYLFTLFLGSDQVTNGAGAVRRPRRDHRPAAGGRRAPEPESEPGSRTVGARLSRGTPQARAH